MRTEEEIRARIGELALQNWNNWHHSRKYCSTRLKEDEEIGKKIDLLEWVLNDKEG